MSYIPRPPAASEERPVGPGRADEIRSISSTHSSNSAGIQSVFGRLPNSADKAGSVKLPSSTRASIVKVMSSDSPLPGLPPIPNIDTGASSVHGKSGGANTISAVATNHRRSASVGDERRHALSLPSSAFEAATDSPPRSKSRLGLGSLRLAWPHGKSRQAKAEAEKRSRWTANESSLLAKSSLGYWKSGRPVDLTALSADLGRSVRDIVEMLEYMLEGYVRFGGVSSWDTQSQKFIMRWAAVEFPDNPLLRHEHSQPAQAASRLDACFSALTCRPRSASKEFAFAIDSPETPASRQSVVADFREGMHRRNGDYFSAAQAVPVPNLPPALEKPSPVNGVQQLAANSPAMAISTPAHPTKGSDSSDKSSSQCGSQSRNRSQSSILPLTSLGRDTSIRSTKSPVSTTFTADTGGRPVFTGGLRSKHGLNTMNRETRARRTRKSSFRTESASVSNTNSRESSNVAISAPFTFSSALAPVDAVSLSGVGAVVPAVNSIAPNGRRRSTTIALPSAATSFSRVSGDSGNVEVTPEPIPIVPMLETVDQSPELSRQVIEVQPPNNVLDAEFSDLSEDIRRKVRRFVSRFVRDYPVDFQQRVDALKAGKDGLCITVDNFADFEYNNDAFMKAIETIYRYVGGSMMYTCNIFFHVQLLHAVRLDRIPVTDDNWLRVNEFATRVFNKKIEDARFVVMQEYRNSSASDSEAAIGSRDTSNWVHEARNRFASLTSTEGNEHKSPFERAFYMDKLAHRYVQFFLENNSDEIMQRARNHGPLPMPVSLQVDKSKMLQFDLEIRNLLVAFIWEDIPLSTLESKEVTLLRALELLNCEIADRCGFYQKNLPQIMNSKNDDGMGGDDVEIADPETIKDIPSNQIAQVVGRSFARSYFNQAKAALLEAMIHDHPFGPVKREDLKEWMVRGGSPFGEDVDFLLNAHLYRYLRKLQLRPSSKQWLQTSAIATLSLMRRTINAIEQKRYVAHVNISAYELRFNKMVQNAGSRSHLLNGDSAVNREPSAFDHVPAWVALLTDSRSGTASQRQSNGINGHSAANQAAEAQDDTDSQSFHDIRQADAVDKGKSVAGGTKTSSIGNQSDSSVASPIPQYPPSFGDYGRSAVLTTAPHLSTSNAIMESPILQPLAIPMPSASHHLPAQAMPVPRMYSPYTQDMQRHMGISPNYGVNGGFSLGVANSATSHSEGTNMTAVMHMFEETQKLIREMQAKKD
ncbi:hypothetical protein IWW40_004712 [Coemansia sp. RSA 1250]|nr:hypothetical protein IWW40_004712 [Coemansia sp. RSA 1250]